jgi:hypothetical protein
MTSAWRPKADSSKRVELSYTQLLLNDEVLEKIGYHHPNRGHQYLESTPVKERATPLPLNSATWPQAPQTPAQDFFAGPS